MMRQSKAKQYRMLFMLLPVLVLIGLGYSLRERRGVRMHLPSSRFEFVVDMDFKIGPAPPKKSIHKDLSHVKLFVSHRGPRTAWWGDGLNMSLEDVYFLTKTGTREMVSYGAGNGVYDKARQGYVVSMMIMRPSTSGYELRDMQSFNGILGVSTTSFPAKRLGRIRISEALNSNNDRRE